MPDTPATTTTPDPAASTPPAQTPPASETPAAQTPPANTPPWERDGKPFDPARAWELITDLRNELTAEKAKTTPPPAPKAPEPPKGLEDRIAAAETAAKSAQRALWVERALRTNHLEDDDAEFLVGDTEDEIKRKAERLANRGKAAPSGETPPAGSRPAPALTPGHGGTSTEPFDPVALAKAARARS
jgi:hypothetical protein